MRAAPPGYEPAGMFIGLTRVHPALPVLARAAAPIPIFVLALSGFASGSGARLLDPLLPQIADSFGVTVAAASAVIAAFLLPYGLGQVVLGPLGDRLGKLRVVAVAVTLYGGCVMACAAASGLTTLVLLRAASGLFAGAAIPLMMAYLGDVVPYAERQATLGRFLTGMVMAQMLTGPIAGVIGERAGWRSAFLVLGGLSIAIGLTLAARLGAGLWRPAEVSNGSVPGLTAYLRLLSRPVGRWLLISAFFDGLCLFGGAFPYVGAFLIQEFGLTTGIAGVLVAGFGLGAFVYTRFARRLVRHLGEGWLLLLGGIGLAAGLAAMAWAPTWPFVAALQVFLGLMFYMFHGVLQARATEALPEARGSAVSAFALALFLGQSAGSLAFGGVLAIVGYRCGFAAAGGMMLIAAIWSWRGLAPPPQPA
jgi:predicted MFS family arabinose efflux permease